ncbi:MAG: hypothetical protein EG823_07165 [Actinobacteria bacterium]|nr:hypothetical protein [Actinomycetota bacterium]
MKRFAICMLALALMLGLTACDTGGGSASDRGSTGRTSGGSSSDDAITTVGDLKAALADQYGDTDWYPDITSITQETFLGADVLAFHVTWYAPDADWTVDNDKVTQLQSALFELSPEVSPNLVMINAIGEVTSLAGFSVNDATLMSEVFDLPPAPTTAEEFEAWLDAVYGPDGLVKLGPNEIWYGAIQSLTVEDLGYGTGPELVIRTTIGGTDRTQQTLLQLAIGTTGSPLLRDVTLFYADGASSAYSGGAGPPGQGGFMYPKQ